MLHMTYAQSEINHKIIRHMSTHRMLNGSKHHNPDMWRLYHRLCLANLRYGYYPKPAYPDHYGTSSEHYRELRKLHLDGLATIARG